MSQNAAQIAHEDEAPIMAPDITDEELEAAAASDWGGRLTTTARPCDEC